jgi:tetratricopeptide (TPR) repeat protein
LAAAVLLVAVQGWRERAINTRLAVAVRLADASLDTTLEAIHSLLVRVGEDRLRYVPAARPLARDSLREACAMYRRLLPEHPDHVRMRVDAGKALSRYSDLLARDGDHDAALAALREGIAHLGGERTDVAPAMINARTFLQVNVARIASRLGDTAMLTAALAAAERDLDALAGHDEFALDRRRNTIQRTAARAAASRQQGDGAAAERDYRAALALARDLAQERPEDPDDARFVVDLMDNLATHLAASGRRDEALPLLEEALAHARQIPVDAPFWPPQPMLVSDVLETLGNLHVAQRDLAAVPALKECLELREQVARDHPSDLYVRSDVAAALHNLAHLNYEQAQDDLVIERLDRAIALQRQVLAEMPTFTQASDYLMNHLTLRGSSLAKLGDLVGLERTAAELEMFRANPVALRRAARLRLRCVELLATTVPPPADGPEQRARYVAAAMQDLLAAEQAGWGTGSAFRDKVYDPLRALPEFAALQQRVAARQSAGAPSTSSASREMPR